MKKAVLGMSVAALMAAAAWANAQSEEDDTKVAAVDTSVAAFNKLDADSDGRVSAIEAANDTSIAAAFTRADADKDGYLTKEEFKMIESSDSSASDPGAMPPSDTTEPTTSDPGT